MSHPRYAIGLDPGERNLGLGILNRDTRYGICFRVDLKTWDGVDHSPVKTDKKTGKKNLGDLPSTDIGTIVFDFVRVFGDFFKHAEVIGIERQPPKAMINIKQIQWQLESTLRGMYPHIPIAQTQATAVRAAAGVECFGDHEVNKATILHTPLLSAADWAAYVGKFGEKRADPSDALHIAAYIDRYCGELSALGIFREPRSFKRERLDVAHVRELPPKKMRRKNARTNSANDVLGKQGPAPAGAGCDSGAH